VQFTRIPIEKRNNFLKQELLECKIKQFILTHLKEQKCYANSKHDYYSSLKGTGGNITIKTHLSSNGCN
jgi:hypothetical protein